MKNLLLLVPMLFLLGACTELQRVPNAQPNVVTIDDITSNDYVLTNIYPGQGLTVGFDDQGRIFGFSGLNRFFGKAKISDGTIEIQELATTRMSGPEDALIREVQYLEMLKRMTNISQNGNKLILSNDSGEKMTFEMKK